MPHAHKHKHRRFLLQSYIWIKQLNESKMNVNWWMCAFIYIHINIYTSNLGTIMSCSCIQVIIAILNIWLISSVQFNTATYTFNLSWFRKNEPSNLFIPFIQSFIQVFIASHFCSSKIISRRLDAIWLNPERHFQLHFKNSFWNINLMCMSIKFAFFPFKWLYSTPKYWIIVFSNQINIHFRFKLVP